MLPASRYRMYLRVGHDFEGGRFPTHDGLKGAIEAAFPRFAEVAPFQQAAYAEPYIFSFLEACIAKLTKYGDGNLEFGSIVDECISDLRRALESESSTVACLRMTSHLETHDQKPLAVGDITLHPITGEPHTYRGQIASIFGDAIFGAWSTSRRLWRTPHPNASSPLLAQGRTCPRLPRLSQQALASL